MVSFGSNLGDSKKIVSDALANLGSRLQDLHSEDIAFRCSEFFETKPVGGPAGQSVFVNGAVRFQSRQSPAEILEILHQVEIGFGRERRIRWDSRTLDLDLLLCGDQVFTATGIQVPHPRMCFRQFVLQPAVQVAEEMVHPICRVSIEQLLNCVLTRESDILLITTADREYVLKGFVDSKFDDNTIAIASLEESFELSQDSANYKLVAFSLKENQMNAHVKQLDTVINWHQGPLLFLENEPGEQLEVEMSAAMEAMKAI